jgi:hypothetical protein
VIVSNSISEESGKEDIGVGGGLLFLGDELQPRRITIITILGRILSNMW